MCDHFLLEMLIFKSFPLFNDLKKIASFIFKDFVKMFEKQFNIMCSLMQQDGKLMNIFPI